MADKNDVKAQNTDGEMSEEEKIRVGEEAFRLLLSTLGKEESSREVLQRTPYRAAKAFREMTVGLKVTDPKTVVGQGMFEVDEAKDIVSIRDMPFHSLCEHHLLPFSGVAHVAYKPKGKVLGLSKFPRLLNVFARRPSLQERLSAEFANCVQDLLDTDAVAVAMEATHACMCHRGVGVDASTRTLAFRGDLCQDCDIKAELKEAVAFPAGGRAKL